MTISAIFYNTKKTDKSAKKAKPRRLTVEDMEIVAALEATQSDMDFIHNCFDEVTDTILIDSLIYELKALQLRHQYYLGLCKEKGIAYSVVDNAAMLTPKDAVLPNDVSGSVDNSITVGPLDSLPLSAE